MTRRPDTIFLRGLEVECIIGFIEWERRITQRLVIDLELLSEVMSSAESVSASSSSSRSSTT